MICSRQISSVPWAAASNKDLNERALFKCNINGLVTCLCDATTWQACLSHYFSRTWPSRVKDSLAGQPSYIPNPAERSYGMQFACTVQLQISVLQIHVHSLLVVMPNVSITHSCRTFYHLRYNAHVTLHLQSCIIAQHSFNTPVMLSKRSRNPLILAKHFSNICRAARAYQSRRNGLSQAACHRPKHRAPAEKHWPEVRESESVLNDISLLTDGLVV